VATATRTKSKKTRLRQVPISEQFDKPIPGPMIDQPTHFSRDPEPLEVGKRHQEAPESRQSRQDEAPDAGDGNDTWLREGSVRGRSRS
jgi:hypothetical protein